MKDSNVITVLFIAGWKERLFYYNRTMDLGVSLFVSKILPIQTFYDYYHYWFFELVRKNLEFSPRLSVRSSVRKYLKICSLLFSETLQLVRTRKGGKNFPSTFLKKNFFEKKSCFTYFDPKNAQKWRVFCIFLEISSLEFLF